MSARRCVCGHSSAHHDPDDGCGACALAMVGPCREFHPSPRQVAVRRVEDDRGSHIEPPLDDSWDDLRKLCWHLAATLLDAGLPQTGMVVRLMTGGTGPLDDFPMYQLGIPGYSVGPLSYTAMWDVINGVEFGARAAREVI